MAAQRLRSQAAALSLPCAPEPSVASRSAPAFGKPCSRARMRPARLLASRVAGSGAPVGNGCRARDGQQAHRPQGPHSRRRLARHPQPPACVSTQGPPSVLVVAALSFQAALSALTLLASCELQHGSGDLAHRQRHGPRGTCRVTSCASACAAATAAEAGGDPLLPLVERATLRARVLPHLLEQVL